METTRHIRHMPCDAGDDTSETPTRHRWRTTSMTTSPAPPARASHSKLGRSILQSFSIASGRVQRFTSCALRPRASKTNGSTTRAVLHQPPAEHGEHLALASPFRSGAPVGSSSFNRLRLRFRHHAPRFCRCGTALGLDHAVAGSSVGCNRSCTSYFTQTPHCTPDRDKRPDFAPVAFSQSGANAASAHPLWGFARRRRHASQIQPASPAP